MAKGLFINRDQLERVINANCTLKLIELKKKEQGFYRYHVEKEDKEFSIDVYYTKKRELRFWLLAKMARNSNKLLLIV
ncbi:hypothetical protein NSA56_07735 [Oceanobacillus caeni]|uniref:hypothetical protein n=1 Tax=Oceanobacillus TaxID=182709 RepID=UPI001C233B81|nr:hypothetical protein [Oceanobacillus caeni]MBU8789978.1 hypothetical protein [Oceanobacillus caeni]MCR1834288.1 hypothetical protein [Oceanobacillus caeni]